MISKLINLIIVCLQIIYENHQRGSAFKESTNIKVVSCTKWENLVDVGVQNTVYPDSTVVNYQFRLELPIYVQQYWFV